MIWNLQRKSNANLTVGGVSCINRKDSIAHVRLSQNFVNQVGSTGYLETYATYPTLPIGPAYFFDFQRYHRPMMSFSEMYSHYNVTKGSDNCAKVQVISDLFGCWNLGFIAQRYLSGFWSLIYSSTVHSWGRSEDIHMEEEIERNMIFEAIDLFCM